MEADVPVRDQASEPGLRGLLQKGALIVSWVIFVALWFNLARVTVLHWRSISSEAHLDLLLILTFFGMVWSAMVKAKRWFVELLFVAMALAAVSDFVRQAIP